MPVDHYLLEGPALISFSGGRTSAYMLRRILDAHGGTLPEDVYVTFANTGKEREETLRFVHECSSRWNVRVRWLEWRSRTGSSETRFEEVGYNSASRNGEPFTALIDDKGYLPNAVTRLCTAELKIEVMKHFMISEGFARWTNVVGLRADELRRIAKQHRRNEQGKERWRSAWPMLKDGIIKRDVWRFWLGQNADPKHLTHPLPQGFDLGLYPYEGNCDACFLKGWDILSHQHRENPDMLKWWRDQEERSRASKASGARFRKEFTYSSIMDETDRQDLLIPLDWRSAEFDAECGVSGTDTRIKCGGRDDR